MISRSRHRTLPNHTCWPDFSGIAERVGYGELQPNCNVCFLGRDAVVIHSIDCLDKDEVRWLADGQDGANI